MTSSPASCVRYPGDPARDRAFAIIQKMVDSGVNVSNYAGRDDGAINDIVKIPDAATTGSGSLSVTVSPNGDLSRIPESIMARDR